MSKFKYVEGMIEGIDYVRCPICGRMTRCLSENHTKVKYNSVIDHNKRIIFVDERHIDTLEHFKNQLDTSTTI